MNSAFILQHLHELACGAEDVKFIGVYRSEADALDAVERLRSQPGFRDHPNVITADSTEVSGFYVDTCTVGVDHWAEGYVTV